MEPVDWRPLPDVGIGTIELRVHTGLEHRVIVVMKFEEAVYVLHAFEKKSKRTPRAAIDLARRRYRQLLIDRRTEHA